MFWYGYDSTIIYLLPAMLFAFYAQSKVKSTFSRYLRVPTRKGYSGYQVARSILDQSGLSHVAVEMSRGHLTDHYDPRNRVLRLSQDVYHGTSVASVSVAAHEVGHAIQHDRGYLPLTLRNAIVPLASFGSSAAWIFIMLGLFTQALGLIDLGILLFSAAVLFQIITLPVEFNASSRAMRLLDGNGFIVQEEHGPAQKVLRAAALTYVAAMATAIAQLLRFIAIRNRRR